MNMPNELNELVRNGERKRKTVLLSECRKSRLNFYEAYEDNALRVKQLEDSIKEVGLINNIVVVENYDPESETKYEILSGNTRFQALCNLYQNEGFGDGTISVEIIKNEIDETEKVKNIIEANKQRDLNWEQRQLILKYYEKQWEDLVATEGARHGEEKDEFLGTKLGVTSRTIRNWREQFRKRNENNGEQAPRVYTNVDLLNSLKRIYKSIEKNIDLADSLSDTSTCDELEYISGKLDVLIARLKREIE